MIIRELFKDFVFLVLNEAYISYLTKTILQLKCFCLTRSTISKTKHLKKTQVMILDNPKLRRRTDAYDMVQVILMYSSFS